MSLSLRLLFAAGWALGSCCAAVALIVSASIGVAGAGSGRPTRIAYAFLFRDLTSLTALDWWAFGAALLLLSVLVAWLVSKHGSRGFVASLLWIVDGLAAFVVAVIIYEMQSPTPPSNPFTPAVGVVSNEGVIRWPVLALGLQIATSLLVFRSSWQSRKTATVMCILLLAAAVILAVTGLTELMV